MSRRLSCVTFHVSASGPMTPFAGDTQNEILGVVEICVRIGELRFEICGVALQAPRDNAPIETRRAVLITGTVDPPSQHGRIANRQLKQLMVIPKQVRLALSARPDHQIKPLRVGSLIWWRSPNRGLKKFVALRVTPESQMRIGRLHGVGTRAEGPHNSLFVGDLRCYVMRSPLVTIDFVLVAAGTGLIAHIPAARN